MTQVTAVVLNYNRETLAAQCIASLERSRHPVRVLIVDNASPDGSGDRLKTRFPAHDFLQTGANLGYAGGNALGVARAVEQGAEFVLVINDDATVDADCVGRLVAALQHDAKAAVAGPTVVFDDKDASVCWAGGSFSTLRALGTVQHADADLVSRAQRAVSLENAGPTACTFVSGCCLLLRADAVRALGSFRPEYFAYVEDVELSVRYVRAGWRLLWVPSARVVHHTPYPEPPATPWKIVRRDQNRRRLARAHFRGAERFAFSAWFYPTRLASWFGYLVRGDTSRADAIFRGTFGRLTG